MGDDLPPKSQHHLDQEAIASEYGGRIGWLVHENKELFLPLAIQFGLDASSGMWRLQFGETYYLVKDDDFRALMADPVRLDEPES